MPRFADMIQQGMRGRGHEVAVWTSPQKLGRLPIRSKFIRKWLGYVDQFLIYPRALPKLVKQEPASTLFVVMDQALGMWVPHLVHRPHVIHCHDFLALRSALGEFPENPTGWTGKKYQQLIRKGFSCGKNFISVSQKTRSDLHRFLSQTPRHSEVVYNGLNYPFRPMFPAEIGAALCEGRQSSSQTPFAINHRDLPADLTIPPSGYLMHIGGNQWYKNRAGVLELYRAYAANNKSPAELWMIGAPPAASLRSQAATIPLPGIVRFISHLANEQVNAAYSGARALLFPSLEEGFGWPIVEAMASGCPVITTNAAPMTEVAGEAARLIPRMPATFSDQPGWARAAVKDLAAVVHQSQEAREQMIKKGFSQAAKFQTEAAITSYEKIYASILAVNRN